MSLYTADYLARRVQELENDVENVRNEALQNKMEYRREFYEHSVKVKRETDEFVKQANQRTTNILFVMFGFFAILVVIINNLTK